MSPKLSGKDVQYLLPNPSALCKGGEGEVVRVHLAEAWSGEMYNAEILFRLEEILA